MSARDAHARGPALLLFLLVLLAACEVDIAPVGLRRTPDGTGPRVRLDPMPIPSDLATMADPTSRTGRRPNVDGPLGRELGTMEGWGVSQPITVSFERSEATDVRLPAIDVEAALARTADDEHDPANDPFYVVNLATFAIAPRPSTSSARKMHPSASATANVPTGRSGCW